MMAQIQASEFHRNDTLVVDLDGTLTPADTLVESLMIVLRQHPLQIPKLLVSLFKGRAHFKADVAALETVSPIDLPWRSELLEYLTAQRQAGRRIVLATAAHQKIAQRVAAHLRLFDAVIATEGGENLKGARKLQAIREQVPGSFSYVGDSAADIDIWNGADAAILVGVSSEVRAKVRVPIEREFFGERPTIFAWLKAMRLHQWVKNILVFVPLLTAFAFGQVEKLAAGMGAFIAFSLAASATYLFNDILDVSSDRAHPRKRQRPFASGVLPIHYGLMASIALFFAGGLVAAYVSWQFLCMLLVYVALTTSYSVGLKRYVVLDVVMLSLLYTIRVIAGSVAVKIQVSTWLLAFSIFIFFSLALMKRCSELVVAEAAGKTRVKGRDYTVRDLHVLWPLGIGASLCSVVVLGLYIGSADAALQYSGIEALWALGIVLIYWLARLWIKTGRGEMHDDPIVFALMNRGSRVAIGCMVAAVICAHLIGEP